MSDILLRKDLPMNRKSNTWRKQTGKEKEVDIDSLLWWPSLPGKRARPLIYQYCYTLSTYLPTNAVFLSHHIILYAYTSNTKLQLQST